MVFLLLLLLCGEEVANAVHNNTQRGTQKRSRRGSSFFLTRPFSFPHFLPHFTSRNVRVNALLLQKRVVVCLLSLSLILLFYCYHCAWCEDIYRERDERGNLEPTREKRKKRSRGEFYFSRKALLLQNIFSSKPNHHRALERNER